MTNVKKITSKQVGTAILLSLTIIIQLVFNYVSLTLPINVALIVVAIGAIMYGRKTGLILGLVDGVIIIFAPSTLSIFFEISPIATIIVCLLKTSVAGYVAGLINESLKKKKLSAILSCIVVPVINTFIFSLFAVSVFKPWIDSLALDYGFTNARVLFEVVIGTNFILEVVIVTVSTILIYNSLDMFINNSHYI